MEILKCMIKFGSFGIRVGFIVWEFYYKVGFICKYIINELIKKNVFFIQKYLKKVDKLRIIIKFLNIICFINDIFIFFIYVYIVY